MSLGRLTDLDPEFIRWEDRYLTPEQEEAEGVWSGRPDRRHTYRPQVATLTEAQGVEFDCPVCGRVKAEKQQHRIQVAFRERGVLDHHGSRGKDGGPTRWAVSGYGFSDLTLSPSVDCTPSDPACWHGHVTNGEVT